MPSGTPMPKPARDAARADAKLQRLEAARDYYRNLAEPTVAPEVSQDVLVTAGSGKGAKKGIGTGRLGDRLRKDSGGFPPAAKQLGKIEQQAVKTGKNPRQIKQAKGTQTAKLLTMLVEFNENANDDFSNWSRPLDYITDDPAQCVTEPAGTTANGPLHNQLANPAGTRDNYTFWVPDFNVEHYTKMLYTTTGLTDRVRTDLTGTDGKPGFDFSGRTMKNMYREMSRGAYDITGEVIGWVKVDHSQAWYGADSCAAGASSDTGHPDNPNGESQLVIDGITKFAAAHPNFPWANYDVEDTADADGDGNLNEPDGVIDHFVVVHAGEGEEGTGGPIYGTYAIWSSASTVLPADGGYTIPGTDMKVFNYIMQPEDGAVGVFAHEYGHDLGLPDLYDTSGAGSDSDVDFWDLMSSGSHSGELNQLAPTHMGAWDKFVLGWTDPRVFNPGDERPQRPGRTAVEPARRHEGRRPRQPAGEGRDAGGAAQRRQLLVDEQRPGLGRREALADARGPGRHGREVPLLVELHRRGGLGLRLRRGVDGRRHDVVAAEGLPRRRRLAGVDGRQLPGPERPPARLWRPEVRAHG